MKRKVRRLIIVLWGFLLLGGFFALRDRFSLSTNNSSQSLPVVKINNIPIEVELAKTQEQQARGLSRRVALAENQGMLFIYDVPGRYAFWMKDMRFSIDILWIGADQKIVDISKNVSPESFPNVFQPSKPAQFVLEVNASFSDRNNIAVGDMVDFGDLFLKKKF